MNTNENNAEAEVKSEVKRVKWHTIDNDGVRPRTHADRSTAGKIITNIIAIPTAIVAGVGGIVIAIPSVPMFLIGGAGCVVADAAMAKARDPRSAAPSKETFGMSFGPFSARVSNPRFTKAQIEREELQAAYAAGTAKPYTPTDGEPIYTNATPVEPQPAHA
jgi:hypothetical protein